MNIKILFLLPILVIALVYGTIFVLRLFIDSTSPFEVTISNSVIKFERNEDGILSAYGGSIDDLPKAVGYAHAMDRWAQMDITRIIGHGRLAELLVANEETVRVDSFIRNMGFTADARHSLEVIDEESRDWLEKYTEGVNTYLSQMTIKPLELILTGREVEEWKCEDSLVALKILSYIGLASTQQDFEKVLFQAVRGGVDVKDLSEIFPLLTDYSPEIVDLLKKIEVAGPLVPKEVEFLVDKMVPSFHASNNFGIGKGSSSSSNALLGLDPHLGINRIPAVWLEVFCQFDIIF